MSDQGSADLRQMRRCIRWVFVALVVSVIIGAVSLITGITSFQSHFNGAGKVTTFTYHTLASRIVLSVGTLFHVGLIIGLLRCSHRAWRAAFALPGLWVLIFAAMNYSSLRSSDPGGTIAIPLVILGGIGAWQTVAWKKQWDPCEPLFRR